jgi:hypothetical protein
MSMPLNVDHLMTPLQKELWAGICRLERFAQQHEVACHDAKSSIYEGLEALAQAMDELQHPMDDNDQKPRRSEAWKPLGADRELDYATRRGRGRPEPGDLPVPTAWCMSIGASMARHH